jgi:hypothetical protein
VPRGTPTWRDGDCRGLDISAKEKKAQERRFADYIWAKVDELRPTAPDINMLLGQVSDKKLRADLTKAIDRLAKRPQPDLVVEVPDELVNADREVLLKAIDNVAQRDAVVALLERNDRHPLARLLFSDRPLGVETRLWLAMVLSGEFKHKGGRPKQGSEKNRDTPSAEIRQKTHNAAQSLPFLRKALRAAYPDQTRAEIGERALYIASCKFGISEETIKYYRRLPLSRRLRTGD